jgi:hypothetical protein
MNTRTILQLSLIICLSVTGCAGVNNSMRPSEKNSQWNPLKKLTGSEKDKNTKKGDKPAETMAVIWKDTVLEKPGSTSVRGFGGRIFFYDNQSNAVKAEGELVVYGFDDTSNEDSAAGNPPKSPKADRKFVFESNKFQSHFSETDLGGSYSVWIPWEQVGGNRKTITLIPVFKTNDGRILKSGQTITVLPGKNPNPNKEQLSMTGSSSKATLGGVQQVGYQTDVATGADRVATADLNTTDDSRRSRIKTSTIQLTPGMAARLAAPTTPSRVGSTQSTGLINSPIQLPLSTPARDRISSLSKARSNSTNANSSDPSSTNSGNHQRSIFGAPGSLF